MNLLGLLTGNAIGTMGGGLLSLINKLIPDQNVKDQILLQEVSKDTMLAIKQLEVNAAEAKSPSLFVAGWRPAIGWICAIAFAYHFVALPFLMFMTTVFGFELTLPEFDMQAMLTVLFGMLGLGTMRTFEKSKGVSREKWKSPQDKAIDKLWEGLNDE